MIAYIKGKLIVKEPTHVVIESAGIGYLIHISLYTYGNLKNQEDIKLLTHLHIKEDAHTLYGFHNEAEKSTFLNLLSISGVGPSTALMVLSSLSPKDLQAAILHGDVRTIQGIKGIGSKTAQRIILELKDKMEKSGITEKGDEFIPHLDNTLRSEALSALITLGINRSAAEKSIDYILQNSGDNITLEELIKRALKSS